MNTPQHISTWESPKGISLCPETSTTHQLPSELIAAIFHTPSFHGHLFHMSSQKIQQEAKDTFFELLELLHKKKNMGSIGD